MSLLVVRLSAFVHTPIVKMQSRTALNFLLRQKINVTLGPRLNDIHILPLQPFRFFRTLSKFRAMNLLPTLSKLWHPLQGRCTSTSNLKTHEELVKAIDKTAYRLMYIKLNEEDKRALSSLYSQITEGPCLTPEPEHINLNPEEINYWRAWKKLGSMSKEEAAKKYMEIADVYV